MKIQHIMALSILTALAQTTLLKAADGTASSSWFNRFSMVRNRAPHYDDCERGYLTHQPSEPSAFQTEVSDETTTQFARNVDGTMALSSVRVEVPDTVTRMNASDYSQDDLDSASSLASDDEPTPYRLSGTTIALLKEHNNDPLKTLNSVIADGNNTAMHDLLRLNINVHGTDSLGKNPLTHAVEAHNYEATGLFLHYGVSAGHELIADVLSHESEIGARAVADILQRQTHIISSPLLRYFKKEWQQIRTAIVYAAESSNPTIIALFANANPIYGPQIQQLIANPYFITALERAAVNTDTTALQKFQEANADFNTAIKKLKDRREFAAATLLEKYATLTRE